MAVAKDAAVHADRAAAALDAAGAARLASVIGLPALAMMAAVNPAKYMAMTVVDLLHDGAREARRVKAEAGPKLSREEYLALVRRFGSFEEYPQA